MTVVIPGRDPIALQIGVNDTDLQSIPYALKEGADYKIVITFHVRCDIVFGLKLLNVARKFPFKGE